MNVLPETDTLYRFRMTGKASSLFSKVLFESGTLQAAEIDPFGATIITDNETGALRAVTASELRHDAQRHAARTEIDELFKIYAKAKEAGFTGIEGEVKNQIKASLVDYTGNIPKQNGGTLTLRAKDGAPITKITLEGVNNLDLKAFGINETSIAQTMAINCNNGTPARRGFQVMGPEGWRTFDQDERLLMAMSSSGKPLIGTMQEYSSRLLKSGGNKTGYALDLTTAQLHILRAEKQLGSAVVADGKVATFFDAAVDELNEVTTAPAPASEGGE